MLRRVPASLLALSLASLPLGAAPAAPKAEPRVMTSPRAAEEVAAGTGRLRVEYSRPFVKGRKIFGGLVPWGQIWRTGANAATSFTTDVDLTLGKVSIPRGSYTLYTLPGEKSWKLIVNRQTGQWGTDYDARKDLARIALTKASSPAPVEAFTISFVPADAWKGVLRLSWDRLVLSVPYEVRR